MEEKKGIEYYSKNNNESAELATLGCSTIP